MASLSALMFEPWLPGSSASQSITREVKGGVSGFPFTGIGEILSLLAFLIPPRGLLVFLTTQKRHDFGIF